MRFERRREVRGLEIRIYGCSGAGKTALLLRIKELMENFDINHVSEQGVDLRHLKAGVAEENPNYFDRIKTEHLSLKSLSNILNNSVKF
jgi:uridine kinase